MNDMDALFRGCIRVEETSEGYVPLRFSQERLEAYDKAPSKPYGRFPASVRMEFWTDAREISFRYQIIRSCDTPIMFDIYENDCFRASIAAGAASGYVKYHLENAGKTKVSVYLPCAAQVALSDFDLKEERRVFEPGRPKLLILGDSICQGLFGTHPSLGLVPTMGRILGISTLNLSVGGDLHHPDWLDTDICEPERILVALGTNDWAYGTGRKEFSEKLSGYYDKLIKIYPGIPIAVVMPIPILTVFKEPRERIEDFLFIRNAIRENAIRRGLRLVDGYEMVPADQSFYYDHAHPNDLGFQVYAMNLMRALREWF